jgi:hypothetical protein
MSNMGYYLVMELLPGESLHRCLRRDYRLSLATALGITRQTAEGNHHEPQRSARHRRGKSE